MIPRLGEVWMVDMGMAGKVRPAVVVLDDRVEVERALVVHVPITSQNRGMDFPSAPRSLILDQASRLALCCLI